MKIDLSGKVVLVTGASRGIGAAIAKYVGEAGGTVAIHANTSVEKAMEITKSIGNDSASFSASLEDPEETVLLAQKVITHFGRLDVLINNAGIAINSATNKAINEWMVDWQKTIAVNLNAPAILCRKAIEHFIQNDCEGIIINISSRAAFRGDTREYMAYAASKGGLEALTKSIARGYGKKNITCFGIAPGFIRTEMAQDFIDEYGEGYVLNDIVLPALTEPKDIAPLITFLASGMAKHATGATFHVNAGSYIH